MKIKCTLKQLYDYNESHNHIIDKKIKVKGRYGYNIINTVAITARNSDQIKITTSDNSIICSPDHLLFTNKWTKVKELSICDTIETKFGAKHIKSIEKLKNTADLYDLDVDTVHEYYANDFVSHNSSISNLIIYMLYGQLDDFTQKDIPNRINKHFEGEIFFESKKHKVHIYRALAPNSFKVNIDGKDIDTAGKNNVQSWLEDEIYGMPFEIFKNSIVLSINDFKHFADLSPKDKRDIIDRMFGYHIINVASSKVKEKIKILKADIAKFKSNIDGYNSSITEIMNNINSINESEDNTQDVKSQFDELKSELKKDANTYRTILPEIESMKISLKTAKTEYDEFVSKLSEIDAKLKLYKNGICPTCGASLETDEHKHMKDELTVEKKNITKKCNESKIKYETITDNYESLCSDKQELFDKINALKIEYAKLETIITEQSKAKDTQINNLLSMKETIEEKLAPQKESLAKLTRQINALNIVADIFSESGLKQYISNIYIPIINDYVSEICAKLGISYKVVFTTGYDCEISFMGDIVKYKTLSRGEKKKVDVAITLAFLKIIKTKLSDINILFVDEVLDGIDVSSCNEFLKIFYDFSNETNLRTYIVHHANLDSTWVDNVIEIEKQNGFSHFV